MFEMFKIHVNDTGIMPYIFGVPSYLFFCTLGIVSGVVFYWFNTRGKGDNNYGTALIALSALVFGIIGAKIPLLIEYRSLEALIAGKSIVGGLAFGGFGVVLTKKLLKIKLNFGNILAPSIALGVAIGRLGCFFGGCCYGVAAHWGFDFGDGLLRLPTQLFEAAFHLIAFIVLLYSLNRTKAPGVLFRRYWLAYLVFRFFIEFIRVHPIFYCGMTVYQILCLSGVLFIGFLVWRERRNAALV